jgi:hypothetical protein
MNGRKDGLDEENFAAIQPTFKMGNRSEGRTLHTGKKGDGPVLGTFDFPVEEA